MVEGRDGRALGPGAGGGGCRRVDVLEGAVPAGREAPARGVGRRRAGRVRPDQPARGVVRHPGLSEPELAGAVAGRQGKPADVPRRAVGAHPRLRQRHRAGEAPERGGLPCLRRRAGRGAGALSAVGSPRRSNLRRFPLDEQHLEIHIEPFERTVDDVVFKINPDRVGRYESAFLSDWEIVDVRGRLFDEPPHRRSTRRGAGSRLSSRSIAAARSTSGGSCSR